jgi:hypothetical protein
MGNPFWSNARAATIGPSHAQSESHSVLSATSRGLYEVSCDGIWGQKGICASLKLQKIAFCSAEAWGDGGNMKISGWTRAIARPGNIGAEIAVSLLVFAGMVIVGASTTPAQSSQGTASLLPASTLHFQANDDSSTSPIKYSARGAAYTLFISNDEADVVLDGESTPSGELNRGKLIVVQAYATLLRMRFIDSNPPTSIGPVGTREQSRPYYTAVAYRGIYPGTDVIVRGDEHGVAFQLDLSPGAAFEPIALQLAGATAISLDAQGNAIVRMGHASLTLQRPSIVISSNGVPQRLAGAYRIESGNRLRFVTGASAANARVVTD